MTPPLEQRSFGEGGGVVAKEGSEAWRGGGGGGVGREKACVA